MVCACHVFEKPQVSADLPVGQFFPAHRSDLSSPFCKKIWLRRGPKSNLQLAPSLPMQGRIAIVTDAGRDAVDADAPLTNGVEADGEVVWS